MTVIAAVQLPRLRVETDGHAFVPAGHAAVREDAALRRLFGLRDPLLVVLEADSPGGVYSSPFLRRVAAVTETVRGVEGVDAEAVTSLATLQRIDRRGDQPTIAPLLQPLPATEAACQDLRHYIEDSTPYAGLLVSRDGHATLILAALTADANRGRAYTDLRTRLREKGAGTFHIAGPVAAESQLGVYLIRDLATMLPLVSVVVGMLLYLTYRSVRAVVLPIVEIGIVLVWVFGLMAACGSPVYIVTAILPVILMALGVADEIHIFGHYYGLARTDPAQDHRTMVIEAVAAVWRPVVFTSITTALGFLSFLSAAMPPLQSFGLYTAFGVMAAMALTLTFIPAAVVLLPAPAGRRQRAEAWPIRDYRPSGVGRALARLGSVVWERRRTVLVITAATALACVPGICRVYVQDSWFGNFAPGSEVRHAGDVLDEKFAGSHELDVVLDSGATGGVRDPEFLLRMQAFAHVLREQPTVGAVLSVVDLLELLHRELAGGGRGVLPASRAQAAQLLEIARFGGTVDTEHLVDGERRRAVVRVFLKQASYVSVARLVGTVRRAASARFARPPEQVYFVGDVMVSQTTVGLIVGGQVRSLALALGMVFLAASLMFRSLVGGLFTVLPLCLAVLLNFAVMGYADIPLGIATSMFASLTIGIGVDYAIHFLARYAQVLDAAGPSRAVSVTLTSAGRAIFFNAAVVALGFLVLAASTMPPNRMLGLLVALGMTTSFIATVALLPAALASFRPAFVAKVRA